LKHQRQKRRARYKRITEKYTRYVGDPFMASNTMKQDNFDAMIAELSTLNVKYLQVLLIDLKSNGAMPPWYGDYHRMFEHSIELRILERTILK
jgi:hypothetical protein